MAQKSPTRKGTFPSLQSGSFRILSQDLDKGYTLLLMHKGDTMDLLSDMNWTNGLPFFKEESADDPYGCYDCPFPAIEDLPGFSGVKSVELSDKLFIIVASFYEVGGNSGRGTDLFFSFDTTRRKLTAIPIGLSKGRATGPCRMATGATYLLGDVNEDGFWDLASIRERIQCPIENDAPAGPSVFLQRPVKWFINSQNQRWTADRMFEGKLPARYMEVTTLDRGPISFVAFGLWRSNNPMDWPTGPGSPSPPFISPSRMTSALNHVNDLSARERKTALAILEDYAFDPSLWQPRLTSYPIKSITAKADSILSKSVGPHASKYFMLDTGYLQSHYKYLDNHYKLQTGSLSKLNGQTSGDFQEAYLVYKFIHPDLKWIRHQTSLNFNRQLGLIYTPNLGFIPGFIREGSRSTFMTDEEIMAVASENLLIEDELSLHLDKSFSEEQGYVGWVSNIRSADGLCYMIEILQLDLSTGEILYYSEYSDRQVDCADYPEH